MATIDFIAYCRLAVYMILHQVALLAGGDADQRREAPAGQHTPKPHGLGGAHGAGQASRAAAPAARAEGGAHGGAVAGGAGQ